MLRGMDSDYAQQQALMKKDARNATMYEEIQSDYSPTYRNTCSRMIVFLFSVLFILGGAGVITLAILVKRGDKTLPFCIDCSSYALQAIIAGAVIVCWGLLGFVAACNRSRCIVIIYVILLFLAFALCIGTGIAVVLFVTGEKPDAFNKIWNDAVAKDGQIVCNLEKRLNCSGLIDSCFQPNATAATGGTARHLMRVASLLDDAVTTTTSAPSNATTTTCPICPEINLVPNLPTCEAQLKAEAHEYGKPAAGVLIATAFVSLVTMIAAVRMSMRS